MTAWPADPAIFDAFESEVYAWVESVYDDTGVEVSIDVERDDGGTIVVNTIRDSVGNHITIHVGRPLEFTSMTEFREYVERFLPSDYSA
jgi:hypothetical protein